MDSPTTSSFSTFVQRYISKNPGLPGCNATRHLCCGRKCYSVIWGNHGNTSKSLLFRHGPFAVPHRPILGLLHRLEKENHSTRAWCHIHLTRVSDLLGLAIFDDEPEIFRHCIRFERPVEDWDPLIPWLLTLIECTSVAMMANFLTILCEEGVFNVEMIEFALKHNLGQVFDLISQQRPDITNQHYLLRAIALEQKDVVCNLLSQGVWHARAITTAAETENDSVSSLLTKFLHQLGFEDLPHYLRMHPERNQANPMNAMVVPRIFDYYYWWLFSPAAETSVRPRLDPARCSSSRRMMGLGIGLTLRTLCSVLVGFVSEEPGEPPSTALQNLSRYRLVWRDGLRSIRRLLNGTPPTTAYEMLTLLMSTYATAGSGCGPTQSAFNRVEFVHDLARWRYFLPSDQQRIFDAATAVLWQFDPSRCPILPLVQPDQLLFAFQDFVRQFIPTISKQDPRREYQDMPYHGEELHTMFEESNHQRRSPPVEGRKGSFGGNGSGELLPSEFLDPPYSDAPFTTLDQGLDVLEYLDIFQGIFIDSEPDGSSTPGMFAGCDPGEDQTEEGEPHEDAVTDPGDRSALVVLLLASVAIGLAILALLACRDGTDSHQFGAVLSTYSTLAGPLAKSYFLFQVFFLSALLSWGNPNAAHPGSPTSPTQPSSPGSNGEPHAAAVNQLNSDVTPPGVERANFHQSPSSTPSMETETRSVDPSFSPPTPAPHPPPDPRLSCPDCSKTFRTFSARNQHLKTGCKKRHGERFPCTIANCGRSFSTSFNRRMHELNSCRWRGVV
ncbi:hypothetical protein F5144DRAFT_553163 [Chaetomium tenue]|uniref:Uncharacterized protein n=1 Tax=Chaetomium tenue TaxID=1854479 RepID=A0ACB7PMH7_9PEZI|nr:hypothetical protein F5144DRAFT_553163 [Chaetomium globosum]